MLHNVLLFSDPRNSHEIIEKLPFSQTIDLNLIKKIIDYALNNAEDLHDKYYRSPGGYYDVPTTLLFNAFLEIHFFDERTAHFYIRKTRENTLSPNDYAESKRCLDEIRLHHITSIENARTCKNVINAFGGLTFAANRKIYEREERESVAIVQRRISDLVEAFKKLESEYMNFVSSVEQAYKKQSPSEVNSEPHIQPQDFAVCQKSQADFTLQFNTINNLLHQYCVSPWIPESERTEVNEAFRVCGRKGIEYRNAIRQEMSGDLFGIAYAYMHPTKEDRLAYESEYELRVQTYIYNQPSAKPTH